MYKHLIAGCALCAVTLVFADRTPPRAQRTIKLAPPVQVAEPVVLSKPASVVPNQIIVQFASPVTASIQETQPTAFTRTGVDSLDLIGFIHDVSDLKQQFQGATKEKAALRGTPDLSGFHIVEFNPRHTTPEDLCKAYKKNPLVLTAEPIGIHPLYANVNDPAFSDQWHLSQANDADVDMPAAWDIETGSNSVTVAVLDTGVRYYHGDLGGSNATNLQNAAGNIWRNSAEDNGVSGVDDDGNGYVDDYLGWDFVSNNIWTCWSGEDCSGSDNDPRDFNGHGTHCAGIIGAINNNGYSVASVAGGRNNGSYTSSGNGVRIMSLKIGHSSNYYGNEVGFVNMSYAAQALYYAADNGAKIASCSWGSSNSGGLGAAIDYFLASGGLVFKAAGNDGTQNADYMGSRTDVINVAATDQSDQKASFSTYGTWVDISAPGVSILSTYHVGSDPGSDYIAAISGTSMATPMAAGAAAMIWSVNPSLSATEVWNTLRDTADNIDNENSSYIGRLGSGRINVAAAVSAAGSGPSDPTGACCIGSSCSILTAAECASAGGTYQGNDTNCASVNCNPDPTGACCIDSSCSIETEADCVSFGGLYQGNNTSCASVNCNPDPTGACCIDSSCSIQTEADCGAFGGSYLGDDTSCSADTCLPDPTGACCLGSDCSVETEADCLDLGGTYEGDDTTCADVTCGDPGGGSNLLLISFRGNTALTGVGTARNDDIVSYDPDTGEWAMYFDGSDVGFTAGAIDAFCVLENGSLLISKSSASSVGGLAYDDSDILLFTPTSLGSNTSGTFSMYFDGSDVELTANGEDIDGLSILDDGRLAMSTAGTTRVSGLAALRDEDIFIFTPSSLGDSTSGSFDYLLDNSDVGLSNSSGEDVDAFHMHSSGFFTFSCVGSFSVSGVSGQDEDLVDFVPTSTGSSTSGTFSSFIVGSDIGIPSGADIGGYCEVPR